MKDWVISYDVGVRRAKVRRKLVRLLEAFGARVQYSVFEVALTEAEEAQLLAAVRKLLDLKQDRFAMYPLTPTAREATIYIGDTRPYVVEPVVVL
ncbi:MAG: CRISPR-associated endonuclease Cas2 [Planctomycetes bacterium]|nr:CRISPR-associated endonuclease Cas2 [Planctomycetota bacterium]